MRYALILAAVTVAVGASVLALLWVRDRLIDRWCEGFHYGLTDDDAPRDDSDWPPVLHDLDDVAREFGVDLGRPPRRINGDH